MMQTIDWLWLIHPVAAVVIVYPLVGIVLHLWGSPGLVDKLIGVTP